MHPLYATFPLLRPTTGALGDYATVASDKACQSYLPCPFPVKTCGRSESLAQEKDLSKPSLEWMNQETLDRELV